MTEEQQTEEKKSWLWPKIEDQASAIDAAKSGAVGGGMMIIGLLVPVAFFVFSGDPLVFGYETAGGFYISQGIQILLAAFLTWRVWTQKGLVSATLLFIWIATEVSLKLVSGQMNIGWMIAWGFALLSLLHSIRGHWHLRKLQKETA